MGYLWWIAPAAVAVFGVLFVFSGVAHVFRGEHGRASRRVVGGTMAALFGLALGLIGINIQMYARLTHEGPVAEVTVKAVDPAQSLYQVTVHRLDGNIPDQGCRLQGDEWLIGGRVQKWKAWANIMGLDATYTLDQLTNKYFTAERGNGKLMTTCDLAGKPNVDHYVPESWLPWILGNLYVEDRRFGSANYMPMADGATYKVVITQSGFDAEPDNDIAKAANAARP